MGLGKKGNKERESGGKAVWRRSLKHQKDNLRLKVLIESKCLLIGLKGGDSLLLAPFMGAKYEDR